MEWNTSLVHDRFSVPVARWRQIDSWPTIKVFHVGVRRRCDHYLSRDWLRCGVKRIPRDDFYSYRGDSITRNVVETRKGEDLAIEPTRLFL